MLSADIWQLSSLTVLHYQLYLICSSYLICISLPVATQTRVYTNHFCNFSQFINTGCEDAEGSECFENKCRCKEDKPNLVLGRFCFEKSCPTGQFYDRFQQKCVQQRRASLKPDENHCRYDYQCFGSHVHCIQYGWNYNCICDPGFTYDSFTGICKPQYGIGGHCIRDLDCDQSGLRKIICQIEQAEGGTCQCMPEHRYNFNIDGCEPLSQVLERESQMRTLIIIFIVAGLMFGFVLSCNFGLLDGGIKQRDIILKRLQDESERVRKQNLMEQMKKTEMESTASKVGDNLDSVDEHKMNATSEPEEKKLINLV